MNRTERMLRVAVIGGGKMGINHINAITRLGNIAKVVAVADAQGASEKLTNALEKIEGARFFKDAEHLLKEVRPDVVHITTPPSSHADLARLALGNGSHVYVEKPFTNDSKEAKDVLRSAGERGLKVCAGHQVLFEEPSRLLKESLHSIGRIVHVESYFSFRMIRRNISRVDQLIDILPHPVYLLLNILSEGGAVVELRGMDVHHDGEVRAIVRSGNIIGTIIVTLRGRPIESYLRVIGTNGALCADFVKGILIKQAGPGASAPAIILAPYIHGLQEVLKSTRSFARLALKGRKGYPGLVELTGSFYASILEGKEPPITRSSIIDTVGICEQIGRKLRESYAESELEAEKKLLELERALGPKKSVNKEIVLTGGTGFLGRAAALKLSENGLPVRVLSRSAPSFSARIPGVAYSCADLSREVPASTLSGADAVVHCAAETAGGKEEHERNSIDATRNIINAAAEAGIRKFVHISSVAVLKPGMGKKVSESSDLDAGNLGRGPYVWGKAEAERVAAEMCKKLGIELKIVRLGPLVDFSAFSAPGRLGRELGPVYLAVGSKKGKIPICEVQTAADVILFYLRDFESAPAVLNLIDPEAPTRGALVLRLLSERPDLRAYWLPAPVLSLLSPILKLLQRVLLKSKNPVDIKAAFSSEEYDACLSSRVIREARGARSGTA